MHTCKRIVGILSLSAFTVVASSNASARAGSEVILGKLVPTGQRVAVESIDHRLWDALLRKYVDARGMVDYRAWHASPQDVRELDRYLQSLSAADLSAKSPKAAVLAFWINAYNAVTVRGILREYPTTSIRNHTAKLFGYNIWQDLKLPVGDALYSLEEIEHEKLRKMGEPRIHFAIVCASIGCPRLLNEAYEPGELDRQLGENAQAFFADRTKFLYDSQRRTIAVSPILEWFGEDFGGTEAERLRSIARYLPDGAAQELARSGAARVSYLDYDWGLNDQAIIKGATGN